jgi:DNA replication regulator DPB11
MSSNAPSIPEKSSHSRFFSGYKIRALGEARGPALREALEEQGAQWLTDEDEQSADFLIVRLVGYVY